MVNYYEGDDCMNTIFDFELDLVLAFLKQYNKSNEEVVIQEMPIRFGNIDIVSIKNTMLPFSDEQFKVLSKPASALLFTKIKNGRPISKEKLCSSVGLSESTILNVLYELTSSKLIVKKGNNYCRESKFVFPKTTITGYEAKLKDFNKAFFQAKGNKDYVDYSYLIFPLDVAKKVFKKRTDLLKMNGIGLIGVSEEATVTLLRAKKCDSIKDYIRLLNIAKANTISLYEESNHV